MARSPRKHTTSQPVDPVSLDETKFWLQILAEHALFIGAGLPADNRELREEAQKFNRELNALLARANKVQNQRQFMELVDESICVVKEFYHFKRHLLSMMLRCRLGGFNYPLLLDHVAREAEYALGLFESIRAGNPVFGDISQPAETVFWLRLMSDHAKFISHLLDPSEVNLIQTAREFSREFDDLLLQGRDFESMLGNRGKVPAFSRFLMDVRVSTVRLRDFKAAAEELIRQCQLVGIIPELLADHVRREAEHFIMVLNVMERNKKSNSMFNKVEEKITDNSVLSKNEVLVEQKQQPAAKVDYKPAWDKISDNLVSEEQNDDIVDDDCDDEWYSSQFEGSASANQAIECNVSADNQLETAEASEEKQPKYKWNSKWPRPLGTT